jgi:hypothetical protein
MLLHSSKKTSSKTNPTPYDIINSNISIINVITVNFGPLVTNTSITPTPSLALLISTSLASAFFIIITNDCTFISNTDTHTFTSTPITVVRTVTTHDTSNHLCNAIRDADHNTGIHPTLAHNTHHSHQQQQRHPSHLPTAHQLTLITLITEERTPTFPRRS